MLVFSVSTHVAAALYFTSDSSGYNWFYCVYYTDFVVVGKKLAEVFQKFVFQHELGANGFHHYQVVVHVVAAART